MCAYVEDMLFILSNSNYKSGVLLPILQLGQPITNTYIHKLGIGNQEMWCINIGISDSTHTSKADRIRPNIWWIDQFWQYHLVVYN